MGEVTANAQVPPAGRSGARARPCFLVGVAAALLAAATKELCVAMAWSSDYSIALARSRTAGLHLDLAFTVPKEGSNITYNALLIPIGAPHPRGAHEFINFILNPNVIASITNDIHYGNDNLAAQPLVDGQIRDDPAVRSTAAGSRAPLPAHRVRRQVSTAKNAHLDAH